MRIQKDVVKFCKSHVDLLCRDRSGRLLQRGKELDCCSPHLVQFEGEEGLLSVVLLVVCKAALVFYSNYFPENLQHYFHSHLHRRIAKLMCSKFKSCVFSGSELNVCLKDLFFASQSYFLQLIALS